MSRNDTMPLALEAKDVAIQTATVALKTVQVNNRQMTQSVFKQLKERTLIDEFEVELLGTVWGWVNFWATGMKPGRQFLVQVDEKLFRCPVLKETMPVSMLPYERQPRPIQWARNQMSELDFAQILLMASTCGDIKHLPGLRGRTIEFSSRGCFPERHFSMGDEELEAVKAICRSTDELTLRAKSCIGQVLSGEIGYTNNSFDDVHFDVKFSDYIEVCRSTVVKETADYCRRWDAMMDRLAFVEQIFIAC